MCREAAMRALEDAAMTGNDIQAVVLGTAPDMFEGLMMPELYLADALGAVGKPIIRVHTAGSVGGSTAVVATHHIAPYVATVDRVLAISFEKQSESEAMWALTSRTRRSSRTRRRGAGGWYSPPSARSSCGRNAPDHVGCVRGDEGPCERAEEPVRGRADPRHHNTTRCWCRSMLWDPIRYLETCPVVRRRGP